MILKELIKDIPVSAMTADPDTEIKDIRYDSRAVEPGDLFVAVEGLQSDGHRFISMAMQKGAAAVLCQHVPEGGVPYILTEDSRRALALVSAAYFGHPSEKMTMVGVTGTNGKTTSTVLLKHLLEDALGTKVGLVGTISNWIGDREIPTERTTPESYDLQKLFHDMVEAGCTHAVMEVSSHALALDRVAGVHFNAALFTNLTQDHLDFHKTMEAYAGTKAMLFSRCDRAFINIDDPWGGFMLEHARCHASTFSPGGKKAELWAEDVTLNPSGVSFTACTGEERTPVRVGVPGAFSVENALTAIAAGLMVGVSLADCTASLSRAKGVKGRVEVVPTPDDFTIIIDYAHTPDALEKVLRAMKGVSDGRLVALFGCGGDRDRDKRHIMGAIAAREADFSVVTSDNPRSEDPVAIIEDILTGMPESAPKVVIPDRPSAIGWAIEHHQPGDVIVLAGKGHETYQEIGGQKRHMDEREIVAQYLHRSEDR